MSFVNREYELERLRTLSAADERNMVLIYGRRRVGKTYLLTHAWTGEEALYFTASATSPEINRRALLREASDWSGEELRAQDHPTWRTVFRAIFELNADEQSVVVLDEFQYLAADDNGLREVASEINAVWEGKLHRKGGLLLVLSGSAVHALSALESGGSPLFGRLDWRRRLPPFDYFDAGLMVDWAPRERVLTYAAFGGTPKYLDAINRERTLDENIVDLMLSPDGKVRIQVETALEQEEGLRDSTRYRAILASVGLKRRTIGDIAASMGQSADGALKRMVKRLVELDYLEEEQNFDAPHNQAKRYRLADPGQRFYYGLVLPNESAIASAGAERVWQERLRPATWPSYVGFEVFEDVVREAYLRHAEPRGLPAVEEWGRWQGQDRNRQDIEIDVVARLLDQRIMTGSIKFQNQRADARVLLDHQHALQRLADSGQSWAHHALEDTGVLLFVSAKGFKDSFWEVAEDADQSVITWELSDLF
jgi:AAA+ ATPase superfamily predicted ATPase